MNNMDLKIPYKLFINGQFVDAVGGNTFDTVNPNDESVICQVHEARKEDVDIAVAGELCINVSTESIEYLVYASLLM